MSPVPDDGLLKYYSQNMYHTSDTGRKKERKERKKRVSNKTPVDDCSSSYSFVLQPSVDFNFSTRSCKANPSITTFVQYFISNILISFSPLSIWCPLDLFPTGLHSRILLTILHSSILCILAPPIDLFNS